MGYVFDLKDAQDYDQWLFGPKNHSIVALEQKLILDMVKPVMGRTLLDVGCGSGARMRPFIEKGLDVTGIDPSASMIDLGKEQLKNKMEFYRGVGESLPFEDNAFNYVTLITSLEFVDDPKKVIAEAARVAKNKIFIGIYNPYTYACLKLRAKGIFFDNIYSHATFFSIWHVKSMVKSLLGNVPMSYKTLCPQFATFGANPGQGKISGVLQRLPLGTFAGILITPIPRFITTPMILKYKAENPLSSRVQPIKGSNTGELSS